MSATADVDRVVAMLQTDRSAYALRPADPGLLRHLVTMVHAAVDDQVPLSTLRKDTYQWRKWKAFTSLFNTALWRDDYRANSGEDDMGHARECLLQAIFVVWRHANMKPRSNRSPQAKPENARKSLQAVRRAHKRRGFLMPAAPQVALAMRGLVRRYVRVHGPQALAPTRKKAVTNAHANAIYAIPDGTELPGFVVQWDSLPFVCFTALLNMTRQTGSRKACLLPVTPAEFDRSCVARTNIRFCIRGHVYDDPDADLLKSMRNGDRVLYRPACSKADQVGLEFGDKEIPLDFIEGSPLAAANALVRLVLAHPARGIARETTPLLTATPDGAAMSHSFADRLFNQMCVYALGTDAAAELSLHGGRIFLATAVRALGHGVPMAQLACRWKTAASAQLYDRTQQEELASVLRSALDVELTPAVMAAYPAHECPCDNDDDIAAVSHDLQRTEQRGGARRRASAGRGSPAVGAATRDSDDESEAEASSDDDADAYADSDLVVEPGTAANADELAPGDEVAVAFDVGHASRYFRGTVIRVMPVRVRVQFPDVDGTHITRDVNRANLFDVAPTPARDRQQPPTPRRTELA